MDGVEVIFNFHFIASQLYFDRQVANYCSGQTTSIFHSLIYSLYIQYSNNYSNSSSVNSKLPNIAYVLQVRMDFRYQRAVADVHLLQPTAILVLCCHRPTSTSNSICTATCCCWVRSTRANKGGGGCAITVSVAGPSATETAKLLGGGVRATDEAVVCLTQQLPRGGEKLQQRILT